MIVTELDVNELQLSIHFNFRFLSQGNRAEFREKRIQFYSV